MRKSLFLILLLLFACTQSSKTISTKEFEHHIWELTNQKRSTYNLPLLLYDEGLADLARLHSSNMFNFDFFAHKDHLGYLVDDRKKKYYPQLVVSSIGENLAKFVNSAKVFTPEEVVSSWMNSPEHKENILNPTYTHLGVGVFTKDEVLLVTQNFATPVVKLLSEIPDQLEPQYQYQLLFEYMSTKPAKELKAVLNFPDMRFKYNIDDRSYTVGMKPVPLQWIGEKQLEVIIDFPAGRGNYVLCFGFNNFYWEEGIKLKVK